MHKKFSTKSYKHNTGFQENFIVISTKDYVETLSLSW